MILTRLACSCSRRQHGRVIGIVRGNSDEAAAERLRAGFDSGDADLLATYDALSAEHLTVYAGTCHISVWLLSELHAPNACLPCNTQEGSSTSAVLECMRPAAAAVQWDLEAC